MSNIDTYIKTLDFIDVEINATHLNYINGNAVLYTTDAAKKGVKTWTKPFGKPQLIHHDKNKDAIGRVIKAKVINDATITDEPQEYIKLWVRISDQEAMGKILRGLYYTVSVGSSTNKVRCSECDQELTKDGLCEHEKGSLNDKNKPIYWIIDRITYHEDSFVNRPADPFGKISKIDIKDGNGYVPYTDFLDSRETIINELIMEDNNMSGLNVKDAKLSAAARKKLPDSVFCGPGRSFPAQDKEHVTAGLRLLNKSNFSDSTKNKIKGCLYRKGKRFGIIPSNDELQEMPSLLTYRLDDDFNDDDVKVYEDSFKDNPLFDLEIDENDEVNNDEANNNSEVITLEDVKDKSKDEIITFVEKEIKDNKVITDSLKAENKKLQDQLKKINDETLQKDSILNSKEDEISKLLDDSAMSDEKLRLQIIDNIIDLKNIKTDELKKELTDKLNKRTIDSLNDTINDIRNERLDNENNSVVDDPTTIKPNENNDSNHDTNTISYHPMPEGMDKKFVPLYEKR